MDVKLIIMDQRRRILALFMALQMGLSSGITVAETVSVPEQRIQTIQRRMVGDYFKNSLNSPQHRVDPEELKLFSLDIGTLWGTYVSFGPPYAQPGFLEWWHKAELDRMDYKVLSQLKTFDVDRLLQARLLEFVAQKDESGEAPGALHRFFGAFIGNESLVNGLSNAAYFLLYGFWIAFAVQVLGNVMRSSVQTLISPIEGRAYVFGLRAFRRPTVWLNRYMNRGPVPSFDVEKRLQSNLPSFEADGLYFPGMNREDLIANENQLKKIWAWAHQVKNAVFTGQLADGRENMTANIHWRENHLAHLMATYSSEVNTAELKARVRIERILRWIGDPETEKKVSNLLDQILEENHRIWHARTTRWNAPAEISFVTVRLTNRLRKMGVRLEDLQYIMMSDNARILAEERIACALALQTIQDISYPEHNRAQIREIRQMQKAIRVEYNVLPMYAQYRQDVIRILKEIGFSVSAPVKDNTAMVIEMRVGKSGHLEYFHNGPFDDCQNDLEPQKTIVSDLQEPAVPGRSGKSAWPKASLEGRATIGELTAAASLLAALCLAPVDEEPAKGLFRCEHLRQQIRAHHSTN